MRRESSPEEARSLPSDDENPDNQTVPTSKETRTSNHCPTGT